MPSSEVVITGAGIIGLTLALALREEGVSVTVLERGRAGSEASTAAAGMLAVYDPGNPPDLLPLSELSMALYPALLDRLCDLGESVRFETDWTLDLHHAPAEISLPPLSEAAKMYGLKPEHSLDPRRLLPALVRAARKAGVDLREDTAASEHRGVDGFVDAAGKLSADVHVDCAGAWSTAHVRPVKGQMLRVSLLPGSLALPGCGNIVVRTPDIYVVPRLDGSAIVGATVEEAGFDLSTREQDMEALRFRASRLLPAFATAPEQERWAGLRPRTADDLPLLGPVSPRRFVAAGHFRNGILLAPGTARVMTELILGRSPSVALQPFAPSRLSGFAVPVLAPA